MVIAAFGPTDAGLWAGEPIAFPMWLTLLLVWPLLIILMLYLVLSLLRFIGSKPLLTYLLFLICGANILAFVGLTWFFLGIVGADLLWGYWLMCVGISSGFILEAIELNCLIEKGKVES